jgi:hypothetical protein
MKPWAAVVGLALVFAAGRAEAFQWGVGVAGGATFPLAQSDNAAGPTFGLRVPLQPMPLLTVEPFLTTTALGGVEATFGGRSYNRRGFDILGWGAVVAPVLRFPVTPYAGVGSYRLGREGSDGGTDVGWTAGIGWAHPLRGRVTFEARTDFTWILEGETSRRFMGLSAGVTVPLHRDAEPGDAKEGS